MLGSLENFLPDFIPFRDKKIPIYAREKTKEADRYMISDIHAFIREMPLRFYLRGGLFSKQESVISFHVGENEIEALVSYKKKPIGFEDELHRDADAPPAMSYGQVYKPTVNGRKVSAKLASRYHVPQRCQHLFVVDAPADEVCLNLFTLEKL